MTVFDITGRTPEPEATDSQLAAAWAAECLSAGRVELGLALARLAAQAQRVERSAANVRAVPLLGSTRDERPREAAPAPAAIFEQTQAAYGAPDGPTGNGDADLAREAATQIFGTPQPAQLDAPETRRCVATVARDGVATECRGVLYWQHGTTGNDFHPAVPAAWRHVHGDLEQDHPAEVR